MSKSIKVSTDKAKEIIDYYKQYQKECNDTSKLFEAKSDNVNVIVYKNNTILLHFLSNRCFKASS